MAAFRGRDYGESVGMWIVFVGEKRKGLQVGKARRGVAFVIQQKHKQLR
jgi:tRNA U34 2-thiouridine synthase MnmA/TrmU